MINTDHARQYLRRGDLTTLFVEELGWDRHIATLPVVVEQQPYVLNAIAEKRGMVAYLCPPDSQGSIPAQQVRRTIEQQVDRVVREHIIIFADTQRTEMIWLWVRRGADQPAAAREYYYSAGQSGHSLLQRLSAIAFSLDEEADLTLTDVISRTRSAFDVDRITRRFYDGYKVEHDAFQKTLEGIPDPITRRWYTSVMLNRLMFTYFIQKKGFLDGDPDYLRTRLRRSMQQGRNRFYREFLRPLFFEGIAKPRSTRAPDITAVIGDVPYLNGGLFLPHRIELQYGNDLSIADESFVRPLNFFDHYRWHLDDRTLHDDREINPEVLGYIFEKYVNQKQMGAYYTKEDITRYIARSTIIPSLFDSAAAQHPRAFAADSLFWQALQADPDRYIYPDTRHGVSEQLPQSIAIGSTDTSRRDLWNRPAPIQYGLPTEIWREVMARRERYAVIHDKIARGDVQSVNDLITLNLDMSAFAEAVISSTSEPSFLMAFWHALERTTILDPTCGSGAFLFAALNVLQPLYEACLDRIAVLVSDLTRSGRFSPALEAMNIVLRQAAGCPNRAYFILKSIIVNNLYGVDIMEEAVEICKLRLFLKLAAQIECDPSQPNLGAEPLPDIDFNIFAGNALVGYATLDEVREAIRFAGNGQARLPLDDTIERIEARVRHIDDQFQLFRQAQVQSHPDNMAQSKSDVQADLDQLDYELNQYLAAEYGVDPKHGSGFKAWQDRHQPFHWFVKFYHVLQQRGGFDVVIGNPPYVGYSKVRSLYTVRGYSTESCANLYAFSVERSLALLRAAGRYGMIVPIASLATDGMHELQQLYAPYRQWHSHWAVRPGKLFTGVDMNLTITLLQKTHENSINYTTGYRRWSNGQQSDRPQLFTTIAYTANPSFTNHANPYPKLGSELEAGILRQMLKHGHNLRQYTDPNGTAIYYHSGGRYWRKALPTQLSSHYKPVRVPRQLLPIICALLNSQLFYWYWISNSNCMDVVSREVLELPVFPLYRADYDTFAGLTERLLTSYYANNSTRARRGELISVDEINFDVARSKPIIDEIDRALAYCYGFDDQAMDFILNYDIKYRLSSGDE